VFFRDKKSLKNADFWFTYSYLDTERLFRNFTKEVMPTFASKHNWSAVYKHFITKISTNIGATFTHTSGRPIYDFGSTDFKPEFTKPFENLSLAASYIKVRKGSFMVFYATIDNVLGRKNVFGYRYSSDGKQRFEVKPAVYRTFFVGVSINLSRGLSSPKEANVDNL
jgi:hypothetical protein